MIGSNGIPNGNGSRMKFDGTISLGTIIHLIVLIAAIAGAWSTVNARFSALEAKVNIMYDLLMEARIKH